MLRNTAGQTIGAQLLTAADGTAFTGAVTVYVTGDGGTQAVGSVGSGACVHEGNGYHSYAPAQAETNYAHVAFTFVGTGAAPATVQVYTKAGDAFTRLGAPVGASIAADIAAVQSDADNIQTRLPAALVSGRMDVSVGAMAANVVTAAATNADFITEVQTAAAAAITAASLATAANVAAVETDTQDIQSRLPAALVGGRMDASVGAMAANVVTAAATNVDFITEIQTAAAAALTAYDPPTNAEMVARTLAAADYATATAVDALPTNAELATALDPLPTAAEIADAVWDEPTSGHATSGTTGAALIAAGSAGDPWSTTLPGAYGAGTAGNIIGNALDATVSSRASAAALAVVDGIVDEILLDTAVIGAAGAGLSAIPWNASWDAEVQSEVTDAINAYDPPTNAEMTARTLAAADYATATALATVDTVVDEILVDTGTAGVVVADKAGYSLSAAGVDAIHDEAVDGATTLRESMRLANAVLGGKASGLETTEAVYRDLADTKDRVVATVTSDGNRTTVVRDLT